VKHSVKTQTTGPNLYFKRYGHQEEFADISTDSIH
jgi:hypothetical protein